MIPGTENKRFSMGCIWSLWYILVTVIPIQGFAEIIPIILPDSYGGYQPAGLIKTSDGYILAGNAKNPDTGWDVSLHWLSNDYSIRQHKLLSGDSSERVSKILSLNNKYFLLLTDTASEFGDFKKSEGILSIAISKFNQKGNNIWTSMLGGKGINNAQDIHVCEDGGTIAVAGWVNANGGNITKIFGGWDIVIAKYNTFGKLRWVTTLGDVDDDMMGSLLCDKGNFYIVYNKWMGDRNWDLKFTILNKNGKIVAEKSYGENGSQIVHNILKAQDGNFIILGSTDSMDATKGRPRGKIDMRITKVDPKGNIIWSTRIGGSENDLAHDIAIGLDGSYWVLGSTESKDGDIPNHVGGWDVCIFKLDHRGRLLFARVYGTLENDQPIQILATQNQMLFLCGKKKSDIFSEPFLIRKRD